jgi:hypothetical protein
MLKVYPRDGNEREVLALMEFDSQEGFEEGGTISKRILWRSSIPGATGTMQSGNCHCKGSKCAAVRVSSGLPGSPRRAVPAQKDACSFLEQGIQ